jgi:hypothetical protein
MKKLSDKQKDVLKWIGSYSNKPYPGLTPHQVDINGYRRSIDALERAGFVKETDPRTYNGTELYILTLKGRRAYIQLIIRSEFAKDSASLRAARILASSGFQQAEVIKAVQNTDIPSPDSNAVINDIRNLEIGLK